LGRKLQHPPPSGMPSSPTLTPRPLLPSPAPKAAAQQLDELLADLGHMQSTLLATGQGAAGPAEPSLDNMLGSLTQDLEELGITASPTGICSACRKPIAGKVRSHTSIPVPLGVPQSCSHCKVVTALGQTWHPEHFFCAHCGKLFGDDGFHERAGKPYCRQDFLAMFAPKCQGCERPVTDNYLSALEGVWHAECFVCAECLRSFTNGSFFELEGRPYCELHFHQRQGNICHGCGRPVTGRCITAAGRKYHPEHFICAYCLGQLQKGTFHEHGNKLYCQACHHKLFL
ncbi:LPXN protein, partial [Psophia crepitans]|nr:LPXN protein [Psophia crepitans]